jgi:hypothetical protein
MRFRISCIAALLFVMTGLASAQDCYKSVILSPSPFSGANGETFKLADGSNWAVKDGMNGIKMCEYNPDVMICPSRGKLLIKGNLLKVEEVIAKGSEPALHGKKVSSAK